MSFFVVFNKNNQYLTNRKPTGNTYPQIYQSRSSWSDDIDQAKVFTTKGAAVNSANNNAVCDFDIIRVEIKLKEVVAKYQVDEQLTWQNVSSAGIDIEAHTQFGTYTISFDAPSAGGGVNLWLAGDDVDTFEVFDREQEAIAEANAHFNELRRNNDNFK